MQKLRIGLDIDNVISAFDKTIFKAVLEEDKQKRKAGIINKNAHYLKGMLDWSDDEVTDFLARKMQNYAKVLGLRKNCKKYMDLLKKEGHTLILITHRAYPHFTDPWSVTVEWLEKKGIVYDKLILSESPDKSKECFENGIDVMFDDRIGQVVKMRESGVNCILMLTAFNKNQKGDLPFVSSWLGIYNQVHLLCEKN